MTVADEKIGDNAMDGLQGDFHPDINVGNTSSILRITWIGLAVNVFLSLFKFAVGILGYSRAIVADAFHSLSDMGTDCAVLLGARVWSAPADANHPYGHRRIEAIITASIGLVLGLVAIGIALNALIPFGSMSLQQPRWIAITGALLSIISKEVLYRWTVTVGKRTQSSAVLANAWHHRSDALSSVPALIAVGVALIDPRLAFVDNIGAFLVSIFILKISWDIIAPSLSELSDAGAPRNCCETIHAIASRIEGVKGVHAVRTRRSGTGIFVDLHILVEGTMTVRKGHDISERVKYELIEKGPGILDVVVHLEPYQ